MLGEKFGTGKVLSVVSVSSNRNVITVHGTLATPPPKQVQLLPPGEWNRNLSNLLDHRTCCQTHMRLRLLAQIVSCVFRLRPYHMYLCIRLTARSLRGLDVCTFCIHCKNQRNAETSKSAIHANSVCMSRGRRGSACTVFINSRKSNLDKNGNYAHMSLSSASALLRSNKHTCKCCLCICKTDVFRICCTTTKTLHFTSMRHAKFRHPDIVRYSTQRRNNESARARELHIENT